jgi:hypothetical protein
MVSSESGAGVAAVALSDVEVILKRSEKQANLLKLEDIQFENVSVEK